MALWTNEGLKDKLRFLCGKDPAYALAAALFSNDVTPSVLTVLPDLLEPTLPLYARVSLLPADWTVIVAGGVAQATRPLVTWEFGPNSGGVTLFGYVAVNTVQNRSAFVERFPAPYAVPAAGGSLTVAVTWYDQGLS